MIREPVHAALFALLSALSAGGSPLFKTVTRRLATFEQIPPEDQPALCLWPRLEHAERKPGLPIKWTLDFDAFVNVHTGAGNDDTLISAQILNPLLDAIEASMPVDSILANKCTLGGLVSSCTVQGTTRIFPGAQGDSAVAIVPIQVVLAPAN